MSLLDEQKVQANGPVSPNEPQVPQSAAIGAALALSFGDPSAPADAATALESHNEAKAIVRLFQCLQCSLPLRNPLTLPCGYSLCRNCLPELHIRTNISYPNAGSRKEGFKCPVEECGKDHSLGDCGQDVTLAKILERVSTEVAKCRPALLEDPSLLQEWPLWKRIVESSTDITMPFSLILQGWRLLAAYTLAEFGEIKAGFEEPRDTPPSSEDAHERLDAEMLSHFKEATRSEMDCQVCYAMLLDPVTTTCGHTFCRKCVARVLDHSSLCPICRRRLLMPPGVLKVPGNHRISKLLSDLFPDLVEARTEAAALEEGPMKGEKNVPLFICTLAYPSMPTFLHIFEPRYRLMIRRAVESGDRKFGMLMYNRWGELQGDLGHTDFMRYGTLLHINRVEVLPDGRSLLETVGVSRFAVKSWGVLDGYIIGDVERVNDISISEEEQMEASETSRPPNEPNNVTSQIDRMPTQDLLRIGTDLITRMRAASADWLHERFLASYGHPPDDPALFPYWFASVLPISDAEKYKLLSTRSVRERLKITAGWVKRIESQRWPQQHILTSNHEDDDDDDEYETTEDDEDDYEIEMETETETETETDSETVTGAETTAPVTTASREDTPTAPPEPDRRD